MNMDDILHDSGIFDSVQMREDEGTNGKNIAEMRLNRTT